ncbi:hypothetical protein F7725_010076 [Dissostichus mawsoni]|uniref:Cadherin domain-containing protein n=1 Tax=Dissostichus mawsoni TaxID=36200 RepID=A0A7J5XQG6_DISMA|nr:hypothetical protein F7725_010076 [Dissostichus mawsoni]
MENSPLAVYLYTSERTQQVFNLNPENGEIRVKEMINYEDFKLYEMEVIASDKGPNSLTGQCKLTIQVADMNDNHPEISIKSFQSPIKENIELDTVIAVVSVSDKDSGTMEWLIFIFLITCLSN